MMIKKRPVLFSNVTSPDVGQQGRLLGIGAAAFIIQFTNMFAFLHEVFLLFFRDKTKIVFDTKLVDQLFLTIYTGKH